MKYTNTRAIPRLIFDIETIAHDDAEGWLPEPRVAANVKDPEKIAAARAEKLAEALARAPLDPDLARVKLITMRVGMHGDPRALLVTDRKLTKAKATTLRALVPAPREEGTGDSNFFAGTEEEVLKRFWGALAVCNGNSVGYNTMGFDLPFLLRRSMALGVKPGILPSMVKYRTEPTTDLMGILFNWSWGENVKRLKWIAMRYGLEVLAPDTDGSSVADMTDAEVIEYGLSDLHVTTQLYGLMNGVYFDHMTNDPAW